MENNVLHSSSDKIKNEMDGACGSNGARKRACMVLIGKIEGKKAT